MAKPKSWAYRGWRITPRAVDEGGPWIATHKDYDGAPDAHDDRRIFGCLTPNDAGDKIDRFYSERIEVRK